MHHIPRLRTAVKPSALGRTRRGGQREVPATPMTRSVTTEWSGRGEQDGGHPWPSTGPLLRHDIAAMEWTMTGHGGRWMGSGEWLRVRRARTGWTVVVSAGEHSTMLSSLQIAYC